MNNVVVLHGVVGGSGDFSALPLLEQVVVVVVVVTAAAMSLRRCSSCDCCSFQTDGTTASSHRRSRLHRHHPRQLESKSVWEEGGK